MTCRVMIYTASGRTLSEKHKSLDDCAETMSKVRSCIKSREPFMFGRSLINPCCIEAIFATSAENEYTDDESRRHDVSTLLKDIAYAPTNRPGIITEGECPPGYVEARTAGYVEFGVSKIGMKKPIILPNGKAIAFWEEPESFEDEGHPRKSLYCGEIRILGNYRVKLKYWQSYTESHHEFLMYPSNFYFDPTQYRTVAEVREIFVSRAVFVAEALERELDWKLTCPEFHGKISFAMYGYPVKWLNDDPQVQKAEVTDYESE